MAQTKRPNETVLEIEHTYCVRILPTKLESYQKDEIQQGYVNEKGARIRSYNNIHFEKTIKRKVDRNDFSTATEQTVPLTAHQFEALWKQCPRTLVKTRYYIPLEKHMAELDLFHGPLEGIAYVEVEFKSHAEAARFKAPDWFGADITQKPWSVNYELIGYTKDEVMFLMKEAGNV